MIIKGNGKNLPFDNKGSSKELATNATNPFKALRKWNLSLRATILLACLFISYAMLFRINAGFSWSMLFVPVIIVIWRFTLAFVENPNRIPLNYFLNSLIICPFMFIPAIGISQTELVAFLPLVLGMTALSSIIGDGRVYYYDADVGTEVLLPLFAASVISVISYMLSSVMFERNLISVLLIVDALLLIGSSFVLSKVYDKAVILSSDSTFDFPARFKWRRRNLIILNVLLFALITAYRLLTAYFNISLPFVIIPCIAVVITTLVMLIAKSSRQIIFVSEAITSAMIMMMIDSFVGPIVAIITDLILFGTLVAYKGHKIFSDKKVYFEGLPVVLIILSVVIMVVELAI